MCSGKPIMIMAIDPNNLIGRRDGRLPWKIAEDLDFFRKTTFNATIVMGRNTIMSVKNNKRIRENRQLICLSHNNLAADQLGPDVIIMNSVDEVLQLAMHKSVYIAGGAQVYNSFISYTDEVYVSELHKSYEPMEGDVYCQALENNKPLFDRFLLRDFDNFGLYLYRRKIFQH